ncbi:NAD dependent epimerase dehydratase family [Fusarium phyllophilum]|uniref:NAD dependent epimerase dehydratase family n=1 Tax=Fusarium phyllophilum TaxID=47803 RepID=A0A8H5IXP9_9HYPO|nr:NAD dependent epimerase dehydratase family [Fusarium phyllophilum]
METQRILITGATGYVGGSVLTAILSNPSLAKLSITALVRTQSQASTLSSLAITSLLFTNLDDTAFLTEVASTHDIVIHAANGYHVPSAQAFIRGLAQRKRQTGRDVRYIHNSGTPNFGDRPVSKAYIETKVFSDKSDIYSYEKMRESIEPYRQRTADVRVFELGEELGVNTYIVCSPLIYGRGTGLFNKSSIQIPTMVRAALQRGRAMYAGDGLGVWDHAHVEDIAALYTLVLAKIAKDEEVPFGKEGFFFANHGKQSWLDMAKEIARVGHQRGKLAAEPESVELREVSKAWFDGDEHLTELGLCSRSETRGDRSRELGWEPVKDDSKWIETVTEEFEVALEAIA